MGRLHIEGFLNLVYLKLLDFYNNALCNHLLLVFLP